MFATASQSRSAPADNLAGATTALPAAASDRKTRTEIQVADASGKWAFAAAGSAPKSESGAPSSDKMDPSRYRILPETTSESLIFDQKDLDKIHLDDANAGSRITTAQNSGKAKDESSRLASKPESPGSELAKMAQKSNNPLSDVWLFITQNDTTFYGGDLIDGHEVGNNTKIQPVMPVPVFDQAWNLIFRPVLQFISSPLDDDVGSLFGHGPGEIVADPTLSAIAGDPFGRTNGMGDSVLLTLLGPNRDDGFVWGVGGTAIFPTATEDVLGQGKWQAGPSALALRLGNDHGGLGIENWNFGFLAQHWWSYAGDSDRPSTSQTDIQYFINWKMDATQLVGMTPNIRINWEADSDEMLSLPIGLGTIGMFRIGKLPVRWGVEAQYYLVQPDSAGPEWNIKLFIAPIILNPLK